MQASPLAARTVRAVLRPSTRPRWQNLLVAFPGTMVLRVASNRDRERGKRSSEDDPRARFRATRRATFGVSVRRLPRLASLSRRRRRSPHPRALASDRRFAEKSAAVISPLPPASVAGHPGAPRCQARLPRRGSPPFRHQGSRRCQGPHLRHEVTASRSRRASTSSPTPWLSPSAPVVRAQPCHRAPSDRLHRPLRPRPSPDVEPDPDPPRIPQAATSFSRRRSACPRCASRPSTPFSIYRV